MEKNKDDKYYINKMIDYIDLISSYYCKMKELGKRMQSNDQDSDGIAYKFNQLREEAKNLSPEFLERHPDIKSQISLLVSFRNRLIHDYDNVTYSFFEEIIECDLPKLKSLLLENS